MTAAELDRVLSVLHTSHDRLTEVLAPLSAEQAAAPSYDDGWSIGQVASHLGSQAELFGIFIDAGQKGDPPPGGETFQPVWAAWDAKSPEQQVADFPPANAALLQQLDGMGEEERAAWHLDLFGSETDLVGLAKMKLSELAVHSWDIEVALDPEATVDGQAVEIIVDQLSALAARAGKPSQDPRAVRVTTSSPERSYRLDLTEEGATLTEGAADEAPDEATLDLPAEALIRLLYGRLDANHTPPTVAANGVDLDAVRAAFPGF